MVFTFAVWLHGYPDSSVQATSNIVCRAAGRQQAGQAASQSVVPSRVQRQLCLPRPEWLQRRVASLPQRAHDGPNEQRTSSSICASKALAKVQVANVWESELSLLNEEEFCGYEFFLCPSDFYSLRILSVLPLKEPLHLSSRKSYVFRRYPDGSLQQKEPNSFSVQMLSLTQPFMPYLPETDLAEVQLCATSAPVQSERGSMFAPAQQVLAEAWGLDQAADSCIVLPLPETLLCLVLEGLWAHIPCSGRWHSLLHQLPESFQRRVGWPGNSMPHTREGAISRVKLLDLVKKIQSWAPVLLQHDDANRQTEIELIGAVRWLLNVRAALPGDPISVPRSGVVYNSLFLVRSLLMTRLLPAYVSWKELAGRATCVHSWTNSFQGDLWWICQN